MSTFTAADFFEKQEAEFLAARQRGEAKATAQVNDNESDSITLPDANDEYRDVDDRRHISHANRGRERGGRGGRPRTAADRYRYGSEEGSQRDAKSPAGSFGGRERTVEPRDREERDSSRDSANKTRPGRQGDTRSRTRSPGGTRGRGSSYRDRSRTPDRHSRRDDRPRSRRDNYYRPSPGRDDRDNTRRKDYGRLEPVNDDDFAPRDSKKERRDDDASAAKKPKERSQEEKDRSTVFVQQVAGRCREKDLDRFFTSKVGPIRAVQIVRDRVSGRTKGIAYVEFESEDSVEEAIKLTGQKLLDVPIIVQQTEAEKNRRAKTDPQPTSSNGIPFFRLYVGNIHFSISEEDLEGVFSGFGQVEFVHLQRDDNGRSKGFAFVQFVDHNDAKEALEKLQGFELAGRAIRVGLGNQNQRDEMATEQKQDTSSSTFGRGGRGQHAGGSTVFDRTNGRDAEKTGGASALDDNDLGGVNFSNYSREALMQKLARTEDTKKPAAQRAVSNVAPEVVTRCVVLKNMWTKKDTETPGWQTELEDDVGKECNDKYGIVVWVGIDPSSTEGEIYVKFDRPEGGKNAYRGLNGRFFGGQTITASYIVDAVYDAMFPKAAKV